MTGTQPTDTDVRTDGTDTKTPRTKRMLTALFFIAALALLVMSLSVWFRNNNVYLELGSHLQLQIIVGGFCLMALSLAWLEIKPSLVALIVGSMVLSWATVVPWIEIGGGGDDRKPADAIKVLQANLFKFNFDPAHMLKLIEKESPDLIVLAEFTPRWEKSLQAVEGAYRYRARQAREGSWGMGVYSKLPLRDEQIRHLGKNSGVTAIGFTLEIDGKPVDFLSIHPPAPVNDDFVAERNRIFAGVTKLFRAREKTDPPAVVLGDMNVTMYNAFYRDMIDKTGLENARENFGLLPTWPAQLPWIARIPIDHVLHTKGLEIVSFKTGPDIGSDHLPTLTVMRHNDAEEF